MANKHLLVVVDYQNDSVTGSLGFPKARTLEEPIAEKIRLCRAAGGEVAFTLDTHGDAGRAPLGGHSLPAGSCARGAEGWQLYGRIRALRRDGDRAFVKSTFGSSALFRYLAAHAGEYQSVELAGVVTYACVLANAVLVRTALPDTPVEVDARCVAGGDETLHRKALDVLEHLQIRVSHREEGG